MDFKASFKIDGKWKTLIALKEGEKGRQLSFSPEAKQIMGNWLRDPQATWLNLPVFENEGTQPSEQPKRAAPVVQDGLDDEIPF